MPSRVGGFCVRESLGGAAEWLHSGVDLDQIDADQSLSRSVACQPAVGNHLPNRAGVDTEIFGRVSDSDVPAPRVVLHKGSLLKQEQPSNRSDHFGLLCARLPVQKVPVRDSAGKPQFGASAVGLDSYDLAGPGFPGGWCAGRIPPV